MMFSILMGIFILSAFHGSLAYEDAEPYLDHIYSTSVSVHVGETAYLTCDVQNLGGYVIMWTKMKETKLLAVGRIILAPKEGRIRISSSLPDSTLEIVNATKSDEGEYECRLSKDHPPLSRMFYLQVLNKPTSRIIVPGVNTTHIEVIEGSSLNLTCELSIANTDLNITWFKLNHSNNTLNSLTGSRYIRQMWNSSDFLYAKLTVQSVELSDSGEYACYRPGYLRSSIVVTVVKNTTTIDETSSSNETHSNSLEETWEKMLKTQEQILEYVKQITEHLIGPHKT